MAKRIYWETVKRDKFGRFMKGNIPYNKGMKNYHHSGTFKKGHKINLGKKWTWESTENHYTKGTHVQTNTGRSHFKKGMHASPETEFRRGPRHMLWEGGKSVYWHRKARKIMENAGFDIRGLDVHHKNKNFRDNKLKNLRLMTKPNHAKLHMLERLRR